MLERRSRLLQGRLDPSARRVHKIANLFALGLGLLGIALGPLCSPELLKSESFFKFGALTPESGQIFGPAAPLNDPAGGVEKAVSQISVLVVLSPFA